MIDLFVKCLKTVQNSINQTSTQNDKKIECDNELQKPVDYDIINFGKKLVHGHK